MVEYKCLRCGYVTENRTYFKKHLTRKYICKPILNNIAINEIINYYELNELMISVVMSTQCKQIVNTMSTKSKQKRKHVIKKFFCDKCHKRFTTRQAKSRHKKHYCKNNIFDYTKTLEQENNMLREENKKLQNVYKQMKLDKKQIMIEVEKMILNNMKHNISNYNSNNTINNNITINNYGEENIDYITNKILTKLIKDPNSCLPKLINLKHFNPHHPENRNIRITNKKLPYAEIRKEHEWKLKKKDDLLEELIDNNSSILDTHYEDNYESFNQKDKVKYEKLQDKIDNNLKFRGSKKKEIEIEILNNSNNIEI